MLTLKVRLVEKTDWAKYYDATAQGTLFCPTSSPSAVGTPVQIEVLFQNGPRVLMTGKVVWRRPSGSARTRPGVGVAIDEVDKQKVEYLVNFVSGQTADHRTRRRVPVRLRVTYTARTGRRINFTRDIHEEGVFVRSAELLAPGDETKLLIFPPLGEWKPIEVRGRVKRLVEEQPHRGMGISLLFKTQSERRSFAEFVRLVEEEYLAGKLPDEAIR